VKETVVSNEMEKLRIYLSDQIRLLNLQNASLLNQNLRTSESTDLLIEHYKEIIEYLSK